MHTSPVQNPLISDMHVGNHEVSEKFIGEILADSNSVHANNIIDDVGSPHSRNYACSQLETSSIVEQINPDQNIDTGDITPAHYQPVSSCDDPAASWQRQGGPPAKNAAAAPSVSLGHLAHGRSHARNHQNHKHSFIHRPRHFLGRLAPPDLFARPQPQDDRLPLMGRSSPANDHDRRQSRRCSVSFPAAF